MSCIHYKFRSALEYDTITFDGLSISLADLKRSIITQKKFGKNSDFDLEVTNAQTKEEYKDEMTMIPKNSSVVVRRIPVGPKSKAQLAAERSSPFASGEQKTSGFQDYQVIKSNKLSKVADLANADASEEDKLKAMMKQSGEDWDPSQYVRGRRPYAPGVPLSQSYVCFRCGKPGHFIRNCPTNGDVRFDVPKVKRTTGIPRTFLGTLEDRSSPTNRSSPSTQGEDSKTKEKVTETANKKAPPAETGNKKVPSELRCPSCSNLLTDAVLIPCCGTSYCDDCIRNYLLENEQECPSCGAENVSPDSLVINKQLRQAVNTFKNARPASPFPNQAVITKSTSASSVTVANNTEIKQPQSAAVDTAESASDSAASDSKPAENKAVKEISDADNKTKESSPKPVKQVTSQPQQIRVHHRDGPPQQAAGVHQGAAPFDPRRRQGDFLPRGPPRIPEPIIPHGLPPKHVPRVPAVRPGMGGLPHPGPPMKVPSYVPASIGGMHAVAPRPAIPRMPPVPTLVGAPVPHRPPFGPRMFDPLHHPPDIPRSLTPPMSEREFYKIQKKLKSRTKKKREHSSGTSSSRPRKEPKKDGGIFDFDDELSEYRELQKSRQRLRSRSLTPSRSLSRSPSRSRSFSRSRSRSRSRSSASPARSPTPEGWDESRSPSPVPSRGGTASAEEKKRKHKKRKKEQKSKGHKKQKTSHKEEQPSTEQKEETTVVREEEKGTDKKKRKKQKEKADGMEEEKDKLQEVVKEKVKKEVKESREKDKGKRKEKDKKKLSDKEKGKESEKQSEKKEGKKSKEGKEKRKKKDKDKKDESSSGKKRKSKKKHKKHKRHKKEKSKEEKTGDEDNDKSDRLAAKESEHQEESSDADNPEVETATDDEKDEQGTDQAEPHSESSGSEETERMEEGKRKGVGRESDDEKLGHGGSDGERRLKEIDEEKLLGNGSDEEEEQEKKIEKKQAGNGSDIEGDHMEEKLLESDKENEHEAEDQLKGDGSDGEEEQGFKGSEEKQLESRIVAENYTDSGRNKAKQGGNGGDIVERQGSRSEKEKGNRPLGKTTNGNDETTNHDHISLRTTEEENGNHKVEQ